MSSYDAFADIYNRHSAPGAAQRIVEILDEHILGGLLAGTRILDVGCGSGQLARHLTDRGFVVLGIDNSPQMIRYARENAPEASFEVADARGFEIDEPVDLVLSTFDTFKPSGHRRRSRRRIRAGLRGFERGWGVLFRYEYA